MLSGEWSSSSPCAPTSLVKSIHLDEPSVRDLLRGNSAVSRERSYPPSTEAEALGRVGNADEIRIAHGVNIPLSEHLRHMRPLPDLELPDCDAEVDLNATVDDTHGVSVHREYGGESFDLARQKVEARAVARAFHQTIL